MNDQVTLLNFREANMERLFGQGGLRIQTVDSIESDNLRLVLRNFFGKLDADHFISLRSQIGLAYRAARGLLAEPNSWQEFWGDVSTRLENEFSVTSQYFGDAETQIIEDIKAAIKSISGSAHDSLGTEIVKLSQSSDLLVLLERPEFNDYFRGWIEDQDLTNSVELVRDFHSLNKISATSKTLVIIGAPRTFSEVHLRTLMFGGFSSELVFLTPNWWLGTGDESIPSKLFRGIDAVSIMHFTRGGSAYNGSASEEKPVLGLDTYSDPAQVDIEEFQQNGDVECRFLYLTGGLGLPVELDAKLVSTLEVLDDGRFVVNRKNPFSDLAQGEVILELATSAESDFLWDKAALELGEEFTNYITIRQDWLHSLKQKKTELGGWHLKKALLAAGVSTGHHVLDWLDDPRFTRPRKISDFEALLKYLGIHSTQLSETLRLTKIVRSKLSALGQQARDSLAEEVTQEDWSAVMNGEIRSILLSDFGDAKFELAQFESLGVEVRLVAQNQVRKVLRGVPRG